MSQLPTATIAQIGQHAEQTVTLAGWVANKTAKGKLIFIRLRDGSGTIQCVVFKKNVSEEDFAAAQQLTLESSCRITGTVRADERAPGGYELDVSSVEVVQIPAQEYPIQPKEHGTEIPDGTPPPVGALCQAARFAAHSRRSDSGCAGMAE